MCIRDSIEGDEQLKAQFDALDSMVGVAETAAIALVSELAPVSYTHLTLPTSDLV